LTILCTLPEKAVLSRQMPTKGRLPASGLVRGAFAHTFKCGGAAAFVVVTFHIVVPRYAMMRKTHKWTMEQIGELEAPRLDFKLTPAPKDAEVTIFAMSVRQDQLRGSPILHLESHEEMQRRIRVGTESLVGTLRRIRQAETLGARPSA